jgi:hypothetical protein
MSDDHDLQDLIPAKLNSLVLNHWKQHQPKMLQHFQKENRLQDELAAAVKMFSDQLYDLTIIQKIPFYTAWWMAIEENLHGEPDDDELSSSQNQSEDPPATSE